MIDLLLFLGGLMVLLVVWGLFRIAYRPNAHDPIEPMPTEPMAWMDDPVMPTTDTYSLSRAIAHGDALMPYEPHAASSQRSVAEALEVYQCTQLERLLSQPTPNSALTATTEARNLGAILRALRG